MKKGTQSVYPLFIGYLQIDVLPLYDVVCTSFIGYSRAKRITLRLAHLPLTTFPSRS